MEHGKPSSSLPTRRQVLAGAAGAAAGVMLSSRAARAAGNGQAVDGEVRIGVIGTGARGSDLIRALTTIDGVRVMALADDYEPHLSRAASFAGAGVQTFADYRALLEKAKPQAVAVAVPIAQHYAVASDCVAAGCDVYLEKTMCYALDDARKLAAQVQKSGRVFQVGLQRRANPIYDQAAAMVRAGLIGRITAIKAQWHRNNSWRRPVPVRPGDPRWRELERRLNWRLYKDSSQGLMAELGSHQMDVANWLLDAHPKRVYASGGIDHWRDGREVLDNIFCTYEYEITPPPGSRPVTRPAGPGAPPADPDAPYAVRVTYSSLCNNAYEGASELVMGTKGTLYLTSTKGLLYREQGADDVQWATAGPSSRPSQAADLNASIVTAGKTLKLSNDPWAHRGKPVEIDYEGGDDTRAALSSFIDHVRAGDPKTVCDARNGLLDNATILIANESAETGRVVEFPKDLA